MTDNTTDNFWQELEESSRKERRLSWLALGAPGAIYCTLVAAVWALFGSGVSYAVAEYGLWPLFIFYVIWSLRMMNFAWAFGGVALLFVQFSPSLTLMFLPHVGEPTPLTVSAVAPDGNVLIDAYRVETNAGVFRIFNDVFRTGSEGFIRKRISTDGRIEKPTLCLTEAVSDCQLAIRIQ